MSKAVLNSRIKKMECNGKAIPQEHIACFNDYIEKVINTRVNQEIAELNKIIAEKFELGKFKSVNELIYAYKSLEKEYTKSRQRIAELEEQLNNAIVPKFNFGSLVCYISKKTGIVIDNNTIDKIKVVGVKERIFSKIKIQYKLSYETRYFDEEELFATKEEAEAKLEKLRGSK